MSKDVTFIIPVFNLQEDRIENLKFILPYLLKTGNKVIVAEQVVENKSRLTEIFIQILDDKQKKNFKHELYIHPSKLIHKTGIINWATKNFVNTKYAWVNDVDFYMKFDRALNETWYGQFIKPYSVGKKLSKEDSLKIKSGQVVNVDYSDESAKYISLYSALSFIYEKEAFLNIGGMDESLFGWGEEDIEFNNRLKEMGEIIQEIDIKGIHLWHPTEIELEDSKFANRDMAVITCHFNWCNYTTPVRNLNRFLFQMESKNIPVYGIELSLTDEFITKGRSNWKHIKVKKENICFQKEACINLVEKTIPKKYTKIAWIDHDVHFSNENWYEQTSDQLEIYKLLQLYSLLIETDRTGKVIFEKKSTVSLGGPPPDGRWNGPPAGALAARREMWSHGGLYSYSFLGASDGIFINTVYDLPINALAKETSSKKYKEWKNRIQKYISKQDISFLEGSILHEWHGDKDGRNYFGRNAISEALDFDTDIFLNDQGLLEIVKSKINVIEDIIAYFKGRDEDGKNTDRIIQSEPEKDMAVMSCFFNWANFDSPKSNLQRFKWQMDAKKIPYYGVELSLTEDFVSENWKNWIKIRVSQKYVCFQKEACLNLLEKIIPDEYTKIAWIDPDIHFSNENWYHDASAALNKNKVVQLFDSYVTVDECGNIKLSLPSIVAAGGTHKRLSHQTHSGQPGAAWAARRDLWIHGGLYPFSIVGGGDATFAYTIYEDDANFKQISNMSGIPSPEKLRVYLDWKKLITSYVKKEISFIKGQIRHEWHGDLNNRKYGTRYDILKKINIDADVRLGRNGLIEILAPTAYASMLEYFKSRNEDGLYDLKK